MKRDQVRIGSILTKDGAIVRITECFSGDVVFEEVVDLAAGQSLSKTLHRAWTVAREKRYEVVS